MKYRLLTEQNWLKDTVTEYDVFSEVHCSQPGQTDADAAQFQPHVVILELNPQNIQLALQIIRLSSASVILTAERVKRTELETCARKGIIVAPVAALKLAVFSAIAMVERMNGYEKKAGQLEEKLDEMRVINRAKLLLVSRLSMTESDAHRYIEKTAMDSCRKRREVAESIIRTYES